MRKIPGLDGGRERVFVTKDGRKITVCSDPVSYYADKEEGMLYVTHPGRNRNDAYTADSAIAAAKVFLQGAADILGRELSITEKPGNDQKRLLRANEKDVIKTLNSFCKEVK